ncbi:eliciting plant response-like protein [Trichoderma evansii]
MQLSNIITGVTLVTATAATYVSFDSGYDDASRNLDRVSCSDGRNGLITKYGWRTQGQIPHFPYIGGVQGTTWNTTACGTCYKLEYGGKSIHILGIDAAYNGGLNIGLDALNDLTNGNAVAWGHVDAIVTQVSGRDCGLPNSY